ncbi:hypothetical protein H1Z61_16850 [Bacillus aquiflavi]|uniref:Uncharacterized protein n=1 Tax=Bacillus aquiflavi TaxID=2672567 RepID=A0A6B3W1Q5_9BACI|nr:contact-dependent growth inhibition system immunity protein [Bacillus aquiflavi]MBA4538749.1 hypothetical protein [Bacillus aquiflavi]NEY83172.1 hypothetical protein [Bacillus aquiflavi]
MKTLKELYNLSYDESNFGSGLIKWYNSLIDKKIEELTVTDISKMIRQDILKNLALEKSIDLFILNPYDGEYQDGELLKLILSSVNINKLSINKLNMLNDKVTELKQSYLEFDWEDEDVKQIYGKNLDELKEKIKKAYDS